ncbi:MAG: hypothetical protein F6J87_29670 [Spirulina sp. SIO3F2]|nr:hypothetical protein [Spirulina sp. SIO3F2]
MGYSRPTREGCYWLSESELSLEIWQCEHLDETLVWLCWWDSAENLLLWSSEPTEHERQKVRLEAQRADQKREQAERWAAKLRELSVDPEVL